MTTKSEKSYMSKVADLGCIIHGTPAQLHHIRESQGMSMRASNFLVIPLCPECHTGSFSVHKTPKQFEAVYGSELDLLALTIERVYAKSC
jgi:hypothetical protein